MPFKREKDNSYRNKNSTKIKDRLCRNRAEIKKILFKTPLIKATGGIWLDPRGPSGPDGSSRPPQTRDPSVVRHTD